MQRLDDSTFLLENKKANLLIDTAEDTITIIGRGFNAVKRFPDGIHLDDIDHEVEFINNQL